MNNQELLTKLEPILSKREIEVVLKRLQNKHLSQTESNYLSRSIRPKLESAEFSTSLRLNSLLAYRRKKYEREDNEIKNLVLSSVLPMIKNIKALILFGSYVRNCHTNYNDIDLLIVLDKKIWKSSFEKNKLEKELENKISLPIDIHFMVYGDLIYIYPYSPLLQTELENHKIIYGNITLPKKIIIDKAFLMQKLLEVDYVLELGNTIAPKYVYNAIRNCLSVALFMKNKVDNRLIIRLIEKNIGEETASQLLNNNATLSQRKIAMIYLQELYDGLTIQLKERNEQKRTA